VLAGNTDKMSTLELYRTTAKSIIQTENINDLDSIAFFLFQNEKDQEIAQKIAQKDNEIVQKIAQKDNEIVQKIAQKDNDIAQQKAYYLKQLSYLTQR
jgi:bisphosphoglycerate-independent phosphoglycerate mutase (AlkP superfamily)